MTEIDRTARVHYCTCGHKITYSGYDNDMFITCSCGRIYKVQQIDTTTIIYEIDDSYPAFHEVNRS